MWQGHPAGGGGPPPPPLPSSTRHPQLRHPLSGQPVPHYSTSHQHQSGGVYINPRYSSKAAADLVVMSGGGGGGRQPHHHHRHHEPQEMIVIDYADGGGGGSLGNRFNLHQPHYGGRLGSSSTGSGIRDSIQVVDLDHDEEISITGQHPALYLRHPSYDTNAAGGPPVPGILANSDRNYRQNYPYGDNLSSDTSSAYSGSDTMHSLQSAQEELDLSGLHESHVDSDEEDLAESIGSFTLRDTVRDCLEKDPADRTEDDIEVLMEFTNTLEAFAGMTQAVRQKMCAVMVFAVVDKADTVVMNDKEELDSWSVIINGAVRVEGGEGGRSYTLSLGQGFGIKPTMQKEYHQGVMTTVVDDCQFVCITQSDYYKILHEGEDALVKETDDTGALVKVSEVRRVEDGSRHTQVLLRATPDRMISQLVEDTNPADPNFIEDFLLCHRVFLESSLLVVQQLLDWFERADLRDKVTRILLLWVNNHFTDFELDSDMMELLDRFESKLEAAKMQGQLRMLNFACAAKARPRVLILTRPSRDESLEFRLTGGHQRGFAIFVESVNKGSAAAKKGLKKGDQILEVNGENFQHAMTLERATTILQSQTHLQLTVKSNFLAFKEVISSDTGRKTTKKSLDVSSSRSSTKVSLAPTSKDDLVLDVKMSRMNLVGQTSESRRSTKDLLMGRLKRLLLQPSNKLSLVPKMMMANEDDADLEAVFSHEYEDVYDFQDSIPEHSLKIYRADQSSKYLLVNKTTSAKEVVMLSLKEFGITECSTNYALFEVTVENGFVRQKRLADRSDNLAQRIGLASRYYIKNVQSNQQLVPEEMSSELQRESVVHLLNLNSEETATQLMVEDFTLFRQIEQTEYIDYIFDLKSKFGSENLTRFSNLVNRETLWVVSEVVGEPNLGKRVKLVKLFLKIAKHCREAQNYNSMFAITSGLTHNAVSRLKHTWERIPEKYIKLLTDLQGIMDPSRNFSRYRNLIKSEAVKPPLIPIFPMVSKDLSFIHLGNESKIQGLVNFEKMRLVAKEIRSLTSMCSAPLRGVSDTIIAMNDNEQPGKYATMKRGKGRRDAPDARKMYNEALMVRKVKSYLSSISVTTDEEALQRMSLEIEPPQAKNSMYVGSSTSSLRSGMPAGGGGVATKPPSPTPSRTSSTFSEGKRSLTSEKFGASSVEAERKLLSLAESTSSGKSKKLPKISKSSYSLSPGPSPVQLRKEALLQKSGHHERSHSDTPPPVPTCAPVSVPVSLSAESSSVASLPGLRRGSVSSQGSQASQDSDMRPRSQELVSRKDSPQQQYHHSSTLGRKVASSSMAKNQSKDNLVRTGSGGLTSTTSSQQRQLPDYNAAVVRSLKAGAGRRPLGAPANRLARTQSRGDDGEDREGGDDEEEEETQVSAV